MLPAVKQLFARTLPRLYTPRVKRVSKQLGLHGVFVSLYIKLLTAFTSLGYRFSSDTGILRVGGIEAEFHVDSRIEYDRVTTMIGEEAVLEAFVETVQHDDVVWDIGANVGTYAVVGALAAPDGTVVAFEPHPDNARRIDENAALNDIENVQVERVALGDSDGTAHLHLHGDQSGGGQHSLVDEAEDAVEVDTARGASFVADGGPAPNVLKIDVEGAELGVLDGMPELLATDHCRVLFVEVHHEHGVSNDAVEGRLHAAGFETTAIEERGGTTFLRATKQDAVDTSSPIPVADSSDESAE
ncbi:FkbM family methyltransferase [Haloarchaeobius salinus]|uniref:FkbM family methyltransferase n=1 Tax=Haloarchaeobius salinus TaxID=1198298 RepID=UPI00210D3661|nr:FkbM family methyltransferase [Haloarchaeobius salinus]